MSTILMREKIINTIKESVIALSFVNACWLEGSDGLNTVDEFSDIDICMDVNDENVEAVFKIVESRLSQISKIDYIHQVDCGNPKIIQKYYHLENTSEYLIIDFSVQLHSRDTKEWSFLKGSNVEVPIVLFDKCGVIRFKESNKIELQQKIKKRTYEIHKTFAQKSRVIKYCRRGVYIEAFGYYHKYVVTPLVEMLRLKYTPEYHYYYIVHLSQHLPKEVVYRLETFFTTKSVDDIYEKTMEAELWMGELGL